MTKRKLTSSPQSSTAPPPCLACTWRRASNQGLKDLRTSDPAWSPDGSYTGILAGYQQGHIFIAEYQADKQVGFLTIPIQYFSDTITDLVSVYDKQVRAMESISEAMTELELTSELTSEDTSEDVLDGVLENTEATR